MALLVSLSGMSGCDDGSATTRPATQLDTVTGPTHFRQICLGWKQGPDYTVGVADAENTGRRPVTITSVELTKAHGITLHDVDLIVLGKGARLGEFGVWRGNPPNLPPTGAATDAWRDRIAAVGASLPTAPARLNFVVGLTVDKGGTAGPLTITYQDADGDTGTWTSNVTYTIGDPCV